MIPIRRAVAVVLASVALLGVHATPPAAAHTEVLRASPGPAETVGGEVDRVVLTFLDPVLEGVTIVVTGPDDRTVDGLAEARLAADARSATVTFAPLTTAGDYVVEYAFSAADGDRQRETYRFTYAEGAASDTTDRGVRTASVLGAVAVALTVVVGLLIALRRRHAE